MEKYYNPYYDDAIVARVLDHYERYMRNGGTIRKVEEESEYGRDTIHRDLVKRLPKINPEYAEKAKDRLELNKKEATSRAGRANAEKQRAKAAAKKGAV